jgi:hypothetical protein
VHITRIQETGTINAADGGVVYVLLDGTNGTKFFSAFVDDDAYVKLFTSRGEAILLQGEGHEGPGSVDVQPLRGASSLYS